MAEGDQELKEVEDIIGIKLEFNDNGDPIIKYRVQWKEDSELQTWEEGNDLSEDVIERYEEKWWIACKKGDEETIRKMLEGGAEVLANLQDDNNRTVVHFAAALNRPELLQLLAKIGANLDVQDNEGYTPLHMATGYLHIPACMVLLQGGASPEVKDKQSRDIMGLIDSLRQNMPPTNPALMPARLSLEEVATFVAESLYDEVQPKAILDSRDVPGGRKQYLVQWPDGADDSWVAESQVSDEVLFDYKEGLEYAEAEEILNMKVRGDVHMFQVKWADSQEISWEPEENVNPSMIEAWWLEHPDILEKIAIVEKLPKDTNSKPPKDGSDNNHNNNNNTSIESQDTEQLLDDVPNLDRPKISVQ